jgi:hypothetical protein
MLRFLEVLGSATAESAREEMNLSGVRLSGFTLDVLLSAAQSDDWEPEDTVEKAVCRYLDDRRLRPPGWAYLPLPEETTGKEGGGSSLEIPLDQSVRAELVVEAEAQGVSLEALVAHAVMYLWACEHADAEAVAAGSSAQLGSGVARGDDRNRP